MRILIDFGCYDLLNMGDVAMLQVAVTRFYKLWPNAVIDVITDSPDQLSLCCQKANAVDPVIIKHWLKKLTLFGRLYSILPLKLSKLISDFDKKLFFMFPSFLTYLFYYKIKHSCKRNKDKEVGNFNEIIFKTDLVVASGGGYITDYFMTLSMNILNTLEIANKLGTPTLMLSQGLSSIHNPILLEKLGKVVSFVDIIALREKRFSLKILRSLGVKMDHVIITGDDAIEPSYNLRSEKIGSGIGINIRVAPYTGVEENFIKNLKSNLQNVCRKNNTNLIPLPISFFSKESDVKSIKKILTESNHNVNNWQNINNPIQVMEQVARCRVVITGSYHPAVFALSQGIPIVGLVASNYYKEKFLGLIDQFKSGCQLIDLSNTNIQEKISQAIDKAWNLSQKDRLQLLNSAITQIKIQHTAYSRIYRFINKHDSFPSNNN